jgi:hypothetical protein
MGRQNFYNEKLRASVTNKCWEIIDKALVNPNVPLKERRNMAMEIVKRSVPQNLDITTAGKELNIYSDEQRTAIAERILKRSKT